jgi:t-SNARE complex subunit (syntaxin)
VTERRMTPTEAHTRLLESMNKSDYPARRNLFYLFIIIFVVIIIDVVVVFLTPGLTMWPG